MARSFAVQLAEVFDFLEWKIEAGKMKPSVQEHAPVPGGKNETVAIDPFGIRWIDLQVLPKEDGPDFGCAEG
jgi:hypothetical protein